VSGGDRIKVWTDAKKGEGNEVSLPAEFSQPDELTWQQKTVYVEGVAVSDGIRDIELAFEFSIGGKTFEDRIKVTVFDVDLLVNNTAGESDDYVAKEKTAEIRETPMQTPAGPNDNHIPMKVHLEGPSGFSCGVSLWDTGSGEVSIKKTDGTDYPGGGETVAAGTDLEVHLFGTKASSDLDDVMIEASTDLTGCAVVEQEDLTVIWIESYNMIF